MRTDDGRLTRVNTNYPADDQAELREGSAPAIPSPDVELDNVTLRFGRPGTAEESTIYEGMNLSVERGSFTAIIGPSGCGKSTLLNIVDGLLPPTHADGVRVMGTDIRTNPDQTRHLAYVFQDARLLPWKTLKENALFGLRGLSVQKRERWEGLLEKYFRMTGLQDYVNHYPSQVSGGMQQRAAIVRAWVNEPRVLLMDEPFSHLDEISAASLRRELIQLWNIDEDRRTVLFVTHDISEALQLGTRVVMLSQKPVEIVHDESVDLAYPRETENSEFFEAERRLRRIFAEKNGQSVGQG